MKKNIIITIGVAGSGKSTYILKNLKENAVWLSSDNIRKELFGNLLDCQDRKSHNQVFSLMFNRLKEYLTDEKTETIYYDATNLNRKRRAHLYREIKRINPESIVTSLLFLVPIKELLEVEKNRPIEKKVTEEVILKMYKQLDIPRYGVDSDIILNVYKRSLKDFEEEFSTDTEHNSIYHKETVQEHINMTIENANQTNDDILIEVAKYHDLGKFITKEMITEDKAQFKAHEKVSAMYFIATNEINEENLEIAEIIYQHMNAHFGISEKVIRNNKLTSFLLEKIEKFSEIDNKSRYI